MMEMRRYWGVLFALLLASLFRGSPAFAMMDERLFMKTLLLEAGKAFDEQVVSPNTVYVIQDDFDFGGKKVSLPSGCWLSFQGGILSNGTLEANGARIDAPADSVLFGKAFLLKDVSNEEVTLAWFRPEEKDDLAPVLQGLVQNQNVRTLRLAGRKIRTTYVEVDHSLSVVGEGAVISPVEKTVSSYYGVFRCREGNGRLTFDFSGFSIIGRKDVPVNHDHVGEALFYFNDCAQVSFSGVVLGNITSGYGKPAYGYDFFAGLISCYDVKNLSIRNCEFYTNKGFEWICDMPVKLSRGEINVVFDDNYIHDATSGASPVCFICDQLSVCRNKVRNCKYYGSLFNVYGYHSVFADNDIRDCIYSSIFDTCEYGDLLKTKRGEVARYSDTVECTGNYCDCANAILLLTWSRKITVSNNEFYGICLCNAQGCDSLGEKPDAAYILPVNMEVSIKDNVCIGDKTDKSEKLAIYHSFVRLHSAYTVGGTVTIEGNEFLRSTLVDDFPFSIGNVKSIVLKDNKIQGCFRYESEKGRLGVLRVNSSHSAYYPLKDMDVETITMTGNTIMDAFADEVDLIVPQIYRGRQFSIKKQNVRNNSMINK